MDFVLAYDYIMYVFLHNVREFVQKLFFVVALLIGHLHVARKLNQYNMYL